jgi:hypothetical protein
VLFNEDANLDTVCVFRPGHSFIHSSMALQPFFWALASYSVL